jgi:hypothetical protein
MKESPVGKNGDVKEQQISTLGEEGEARNKLGWGRGCKAMILNAPERALC